MRQVDVELDVPDDAECSGHIARRRNLARVHLPVANRQRVQLVSIAPRHRARRVRIQPAAEEKDCFQVRLLITRPAVSAPQMYLCALELQPYLAAVRLRIHAASSFAGGHRDRRKQHRRRAADELVARDDVLGEFVVGSVLNDELHLVVRRQQVEVLPVILRDSPLPGHFTSMIRITAGGTSLMLSGRRSRPSPSCRPEQLFHQRIHVALQQRLAAGHLDELAS